jgi:hypothetical protein
VVSPVQEFPPDRNISSAHGLVASPFKAGYVCAKHALEVRAEGPEGMTRGLAARDDSAVDDERAAVAEVTTLEPGSPSSSASSRHLGCDYLGRRNARRQQEHTQQ